MDSTHSDKRKRPKEKTLLRNYLEFREAKRPGCSLVYKLNYLNMGIKRYKKRRPGRCGS